MNNKYCIADIMKVINVLQNNSKRIECCNDTCTRGYLGPIEDSICYNTRVINLYRCDNSLVSFNYTLNGASSTSNSFRIMDVNDDSVLLLLLVSNTDGTYTSANTYVTVNLKCICAIRCVGDINLVNF